MRALSQYWAQEESELSLTEGDHLQVRFKDVVSGWWEGVCVSSANPDCIGGYGWFPSNFVAVVRGLYAIEEAEEGNETPTPRMGTPMSKGRTPISGSESMMSSLPSDQSESEAALFASPASENAFYKN